MFITENDLKRIVNKEISSEQAKRREEALKQAEKVNIRPGIMIAPGILIQSKKE